MNCRIARIRKGITQKELAKMVGISNTTLVKIEKDEIDNVKFGTLKAIAKILNADIKELFFSEID